MEENEDEEVLAEVDAKLFEVAGILERACKKVTTSKFAKETDCLIEEE